MIVQQIMKLYSTKDANVWLQNKKNYYKIIDIKFNDTYIFIIYEKSIDEYTYIKTILF